MYKRFTYYVKNGKERQNLRNEVQNEFHAASIAILDEMADLIEKTRQEHFPKIARLCFDTAVDDIGLCHTGQAMADANEFVMAWIFKEINAVMGDTAIYDAWQEKHGKTALEQVEQCGDELYEEENNAIYDEDEEDDE